MTKRHAVIRGRRATDDLLQAEISGPDGLLRFACPDCGTSIVIATVDEVTCGSCGSAFIVQRRGAAPGRRRVAVRRKPVA